MSGDSKTRAEVWAHVSDGAGKLGRVLELINTRSVAEQAEAVPAIKRALIHLADCVAWLENDLDTSLYGDTSEMQVKKKGELN